MQQLLTQELLLGYIPRDVHARPYLALVVEDREGREAIAPFEDHVFELDAAYLAGGHGLGVRADILGVLPAVEQVIALAPDKLLRGGVELPGKGLVYLYYPVLAVVYGDEVLDGVERSDPLLLALYDKREELGVLLRPLLKRVEHAVEGVRQVAYLVLSVDPYPLVYPGLAVSYPLYDLDVSPYGAGYRLLDKQREQDAAYGDGEEAR